jgi:hypothetical protein
MSNPLNLHREREDRINQEFLRQLGYQYADYVDPTYPGESSFCFDDNNKPYPAREAPRNERGTFSQAVHFDKLTKLNTWDQWERPAGMGVKEYGYRSAYTNAKTGEQRFFCDCGADFSDAQHRKRHEQTQHGMKWT